ncbi:MAG: polysaccharide biosynthesis C-terminal domain-containing protein, partial [Candidatus Komeilibacteria bacterium]|nr:polysaccharide biosynthesis C-terminal domain-containing protein [Candidatus Komeilibacteria bacterium]
TAAIALFLYFVFIPRYSYWAAAGATVFIELLYMIFAFYVSYKHSHVGVNLRNLGRVLLACAIMGMALYLTASFHVIWGMIVGTVVYFGALYGIGGINKEIIAELKSIRQSN